MIARYCPLSSSLYLPSGSCDGLVPLGALLYGKEILRLLPSPEQFGQILDPSPAFLGVYIITLEQAMREQLVKMWFGINAPRSSGLLDDGVSGLELTMDSTSQSKVRNDSPLSHPA